MADDFGEIDIVDLLGVNMAEVEEARMGDILPRFFGQFECGEPTHKELKHKETGKTIGAIFVFPWKCMAVLDKGKSAEDGVSDPATLINKIHMDVHFIKSPESLKYLKGYVADVGGNKNASLQDAIKSVAGKRVAAVIAHRADQNDSDKKYARLTKYKPI